jgi:hypothetical protein
MMNMQHTSLSLIPFRQRDSTAMSLGGSETTEAISLRFENKEIATLPSVARNDNPRITRQSQERCLRMGR